MFPFLNFHDNFICLTCIALNNIPSRSKNKWSPFWPLYPYHVGNFAGLLFLHVSLCMLFQPSSSLISMITTRDIKGVQTGDQEIKMVNFADDDYFLRWHQLLCQTQAHSLSDTIREVFQLKNILALTVIKRFWRSLTHILICF